MKSTKKTEESERKNTMEKLQLFQSIVETHEKSMDKLREENLSLQKALDEVANGTTITKRAWGEDATGDEITNARDGDRTGGTISPVEWARNADEMKAGKNGRHLFYQADHYTNLYEMQFVVEASFWPVFCISILQMIVANSKSNFKKIMASFLGFIIWS